MTDVDLSPERGRPTSEDEQTPPADQIRKPSWKYTFTNALQQFGRDECTDLAAGLTFFSVLAMFPALIAIVSLLGVFGNGPEAVTRVLDIASDLGAPTDTIEPIVDQLARSPGAGLALALGLLGALWSASGYVGAFARAMNRVYAIDEGRPIWKLRPLQVLITMVLVVLATLLMVGLVVSGPVARSIGSVIGLGDTAVLAWSIAKWPVMLLFVVLMVALLYFATPNVKQPKFRWLSFGAGIAILSWGTLSAGFGFYVANFGSFNKTYGALAGVIVFLLWLWITNNALLFGAEVDAELERSRQLQAGIRAEETIQLPPRDDRNIRKAARKRQQKIDQGRGIREHNRQVLDTTGDGPHPQDSSDRT